MNKAATQMTIFYDLKMILIRPVVRRIVLFPLLVLCALLSFVSHAQESVAGLGEGEWYVRLVVESDQAGLKDAGNVLGQLRESETGADIHDLKELEPYSSPYLSVVFHQEDWGDLSGLYSSDYRGLDAGEGSSAGTIWRFEVRSDDVTREVKLSWDGSDRGRLLESVLIDELTGEEIKVAEIGVVGTTVFIAPLSYTFNMGGETIRRFRWEQRAYGGRLDRDNELTERTYVENHMAILDVPAVPPSTGEAGRAAVETDSAETRSADPVDSGLLSEGRSEVEILPQLMRTDYYLGSPPLTN